MIQQRSNSDQFVTILSIQQGHYFQWKRFLAPQLKKEFTIFLDSALKTEQLSGLLRTFK